jgi:hypothetical protein
VSVVFDGEVVTVVGGDSDERRLWLRLPPGAVGRVSQLGFVRRQGYPPGGGDPRPLAVQIFEIRALRMGDGWASAMNHPWQREAMRVEVEGNYESEQFPGAEDGMWLGPRALVRLPAAVGRIRLRLWAPRPSPPRTEIWIGGRHAAGPLGIESNPGDYVVEVLAGDVVDGRLEVEIRSDPYRPSDDGALDPRELGVVLSDVSFEPRKAGS